MSIPGCLGVFTEIVLERQIQFYSAEGTDSKHPIDSIKTLTQKMMYRVIVIRLNWRSYICCSQYRSQMKRNAEKDVPEGPVEGDEDEVDGDQAGDEGGKRGCKRKRVYGMLTLYII